MCLKGGFDCMNDKVPQSHSKAERTCAHFIQITKQLILAEGINNTSVRKVADRAGYSYATIYNHFGDMEELLLQTKISMMNDFLLVVEQEFPNGVSSVEDIKQLNRLHLSYYMKTPHVFQFFYQYQIKPQKMELPILPQYGELWRSNFEKLAKGHIIAETEIDLVSKTLIYTLHGILTLYFSNNELSFDRLCEDLDMITEKLLERRL